MQKSVSVESNEIKEAGTTTVLELTVNNHPGVMSHICGLFSRRAYNVEGIVCIPVGNGEKSSMWLQVNEAMKLEQIVKQVQKLPDVLSVIRHNSGHKIFSQLENFK